MIIIGMSTGIVCGILLLTKSKNKNSNKFLGLAIFGFVWLNTKTLLLSLNLWQIHGFGYFPNGVELALPPLFYFFLKASVRPIFRLEPKHYLHFIPFFISQAYATIVYIAIMQTPISTEKLEIANTYYFNDVKLCEEYLLLISAFVYLYLGYYQIRRYRNWLGTYVSDTKYSELNFLNTLFYGVIFIMAYLLINLILSFFLTNEYYWRWQLVHLFIAALVYYLGLAGYKNSDLTPESFVVKSKIRAEKNISADLINEVIGKLEIAFKRDKVHLNPRLTLQELAKIIGVGDGLLSSIINVHYAENFRSIINNERVAEVKTRLLNADSNKLSFMGLATECGFNSEASFYRIFKKATGLTPRQFVDKYRECSETESASY